MFWWVVYFMFNVNYVFRVIIVRVLLFILICIYRIRIIYVKFLVLVVYISGIVVFILYISCICWGGDGKLRLVLLCLIGFRVKFFDQGVKMVDLGGIEGIWIYILIAWLFNIIVLRFSKELFKVAGSLRF